MSIYKTYHEFEISVDYDYQPYEKQVLYPNEDAYPGCPEQVTVTGIYIPRAEPCRGIPRYSDDILPYLSAKDIEVIEQEIMDAIHDGAGA